MKGINRLHQILEALLPSSTSHCTIRKVSLFSFSFLFQLLKAMDLATAVKSFEAELVYHLRTGFSQISNGSNTGQNGTSFHFPKHFFYLQIDIFFLYKPWVYFNYAFVKYILYQHILGVVIVWCPCKLLQLHFELIGFS